MYSQRGARFDSPLWLACGLPALLLIAVFLPDAAAQNLAAMGQASIVVLGVVQKGGDDVDLVARGGGFFVDSKHVVTSLFVCCGKTKDGKSLRPIVVIGGKPVAAKPVWSLQEGDMAVLELDGTFNNPTATLAPISLASKAQPVLILQYPDDLKQNPSWLKGQVTDISKFKDSNIQLVLSNAQAMPANDGSALWDTCGDVIGVNYNFKDGTLVSVQTDQLIEGLKANGVQFSPLATQPCATPAGGGGGGGQSGGGGQGGGQAGGGGQGGGGQAKQKEKGKPSEDEDEDAGNHWRLPKGNEWIPVIVIAVIVIFALRPAGKQVARALTTRRRAPIPEPAAYPYQPPVPYQAAAPLPPFSPMAPPNPMAAPPPMGTKPVLRGVAGQYAGSSVGLETNPSTLGRDPHSANLVFGAEAGSVSKRHCTVRWDPHRGVFVLEDHGSTNGTFLASGERLAPNQPRDLRPGERFYIGDLRNQFEVGFDA